MPKVKLLVYPVKNVVVPFVWFFLTRKRDKAERWRKGGGYHPDLAGGLLEENCNEVASLP